MNHIQDNYQELKANPNIVSDILKFPTNKCTKNERKKGWVCNLSQQYVFSQQHHEYLQIKTPENTTQFPLICKLLEADTCRVIYFDDHLTTEQLTELRRRQRSSKTELLHAKIAYFFSSDVSTLYA